MERESQREGKHATKFAAESTQLKDLTSNPTLLALLKVLTRLTAFHVSIRTEPILRLPIRRLACWPCMTCASELLNIWHLHLATTRIGCPLCCKFDKVMPGLAHLENGRWQHTASCNKGTTLPEI